MEGSIPMPANDGLRIGEMLPAPLAIGAGVKETEAICATTKAAKKLMLRGRKVKCIN